MNKEHYIQAYTQQINRKTKIHKRITRIYIYDYCTENLFQQK